MLLDIVWVSERNDLEPWPRTVSTPCLSSLTAYALYLFIKPPTYSTRFFV